MVTEDVKRKLENDEFMVRSEELGMTNLSTLMPAIEEGFRSALKEGNFDTLAETLGQVYLYLS